MPEERKVRLIRKHERGTYQGGARAAKVAESREQSEREIKTVVSRWIRDHRQRSEEFRKNFANLLRAGEFHLPTR